MIIIILSISLAGSGIGILFFLSLLFMKTSLTSLPLILGFWLILVSVFFRLILFLFCLFLFFWKKLLYRQNKNSQNFTTIVLFSFSFSSDTWRNILIWFNSFPIIPESWKYFFWSTYYNSTFKIKKIIHYHNNLHPAPFYSQPKVPVCFLANFDAIKHPVAVQRPNIFSWHINNKNGLALPLANTFELQLDFNQRVKLSNINEIVAYSNKSISKQTKWEETILNEKMFHELYSTDIGKDDRNIQQLVYSTQDLNKEIYNNVWQKWRHWITTDISNNYQGFKQTGTWFFSRPSVYWNTFFNNFKHTTYCEDDQIRKLIKKSGNIKSTSLKRTVMLDSFQGTKLISSDPIYEFCFRNIPYFYMTFLVFPFSFGLEMNVFFTSFFSIIITILRIRRLYRLYVTLNKWIIIIYVQYWLPNCHLLFLYFFNLQFYYKKWILKKYKNKQIRTEINAWRKKTQGKIQIHWINW